MIHVAIISILKRASCYYYAQISRQATPIVDTSSYELVVLNTRSFMLYIVHALEIRHPGITGTSWQGTAEYRCDDDVACRYVAVLWPHTQVVQINPSLVSYRINTWLWTIDTAA